MICPSTPTFPCPRLICAWAASEDFFGGYDYQAQAGIVHIANHHISPGKKQWTWGNHEFGYAWDRNLTDADAHGEFPPYIEIMAGVYTDNQPDFSFLQPGETKSWSQYWYPIQKIGPAQHANLNAAISLNFTKGEMQLGVAVTSNQPRAASLRFPQKGKNWRNLTVTFHLRCHSLKKSSCPKMSRKRICSFASMIRLDAN